MFPYVGFGASFPRNLGDEELRLSINPESTDDSERRLHDLERQIRLNQGDIDILYGLIAALKIELASLKPPPVLDESMTSESEEVIPAEFEEIIPIEKEEMLPVEVIEPEPVMLAPPEPTEEELQEAAMAAALLDQQRLEAESARNNEPPVIVQPKVKPVLGYWDIRGLAQGLRYQMVFIGLLFEDRYYVHTEDVFSRAVWLDQRYNMDLDFPNLPYFIDGDIRLTEHLAIHKYVADKWMPSLLGTNLYEKAHVDMLCGVIWDLKKSATMGCYAGDDKAFLTRLTLAKM